MPGKSLQLGLERCIQDPPQTLVGRRFGVLCNHASVDAEYRPSCEVLAAAFPGQLASVFSPQHGFWGEQQANMDETPHGFYEPLSLPLHSLYCQQRFPTDEMLDGLDCFVIDLQDVGTRVYTFVWTVSHCLEACAARGVHVVLLDRPNPLGGLVVEGPAIESGFESFVGRLAIPMRHGLTLGELALWINRQFDSPASFEVVPMSGWRREMLWPDCSRMWVPTSPNVPRFESLLLYPGQVLFEGTNLSEGRGTTTPFEFVGAPFICPYRLTRALESCRLPGLQPVATRFRPTFDKWAGQSCGGIALRITDPYSLRSYLSTLSVLFCIKRLWPTECEWLPPPYEYELEKMPIDILSGSARLRETILTGRTAVASVETVLTDRVAAASGEAVLVDGIESARKIAELAAVDTASWIQTTADCRLYA